jgi:hypothetical protein
MPLPSATVTPEAFPASEERQKPEHLTPTTPESIGVTAEKLSPIAQAGVSLTKRVLRIMVGSIGALLCCLLIVELLLAWNADSANKAALARETARMEVASGLVRGLDQLSVDLAEARSDASLTWERDSLRNAHLVLKMIGRLPGVAAEHKAQLSACVPPPAAASRGAQLDRCLATVEGLTRAVLDPGSSASGCQTTNEAAVRPQDQRANFHQFWLQTAQLVLLNLLLPILTALLGYIFGTHRS